MRLCGYHCLEKLLLYASFEALEAFHGLIITLAHSRTILVVPFYCRFSSLFSSASTANVQNKPNDGTTEMTYATLTGGNHRSHTIGQCHVDGMNWPASYWDHTRNAEMNSQAAR